MCQDAEVHKRLQAMSGVASILAAEIERPTSRAFDLPFSHDRWAQIAKLYEDGGMLDTAHRIRQYVRKEIGL